MLKTDLVKCSTDLRLTRSIFLTELLLLFPLPTYDSLIYALSGATCLYLVIFLFQLSFHDPFNMYHYFYTLTLWHNSIMLQGMKNLEKYTENTF